MTLSIEQAGSESSGAARRKRTSIFELAIRLGLLGILLYWSLTLVRPFIPIFIWSVVIAVALYPAYQWMARKLGGREKLASALLTGLSLLVVIGPAAWLGLGLIESVQLLSERVNWQELAVPPAPASIKSWPVIGEELHRLWTFAADNTRDAISRIVPYLKPVGGTLLHVAAGTGTGIIKFLASIVLAGFLFVSAPTLTAGLRKLARKLEFEKGDHFVDLANSTIRAVSRGVIGISVLQALLAGIGLAAAGVPAASLITFAILVLGIVQIGPTLVIIPVIVWSWMTMDTTTAFLFTAYMVPVNLVDNILKPFVLGQGLGVPVLVILLGVIGGTLSYGITGLFLGPIILAVIWELLTAWIEHDGRAHN
jgi:predicted PurR-regulated permease PerM